MTEAYINDCLFAAALALRPSGYCFLWVDAILLCEGFHRKIEGVLPCVDLIAWDNQGFGNGYSSRRCGDYLLVLQTPPTRAKGNLERPQHSRSLEREGPEGTRASLTLNLTD